MEPVDLYCFSGTGNTLVVARAVCDRLIERGVGARLHRLEDCDPAGVDLSHVVGIACPVAAQSTYPLVWDFVRGLPPADGTGAFLVDTLALFSGGIVGPIRRSLTGKGYAPLGALEVRMPNNFFEKRANPARTATKIQAGIAKARGFADALVDGRAAWRRAWFWEWPFLFGARFAYGKLGLVRRLARLSVDTDRCTQCGLCETLCPVGAITRPDGRPEFTRHCIVCLRCFSYCPAEAILLRGKHYVRNRPVKPEDFRGDSAKWGVTSEQ